MTSPLLAPAQAGDEQAFRELISPFRRELHLHCYRLLGSATDADDVMQEILLSAWRGLADFAGRSSLRTWLYRIATNQCLNAIRASKRRPPLEPVPPFDPPTPSRRGETTWLQPYPDRWLDELDGSAHAQGDPVRHSVARETVELAFIAALQRMPPRQAAALVLIDVLGFTGLEVADLMDTTPTAVKGALQRARASLPVPSAAHNPTSAGPEERVMAQRFAQAFVADDIAGVTSLLTDDAWLAMPPAPHEYVGRRAIAEFLTVSAIARHGSTIELDPIGVNRQPAFRCQVVDASGTRRAGGMLVLDIVGDRLCGITRFLPVTQIGPIP